MKRVGNIYHKIISPENLRLAEKKASRGKRHQPSVKAFSRNAETNLFLLHELLLNNQFKTSPYTVFKVYEPKEREVYRLPYYPDRIVHHAIMNVLEPVFVSHFTADTYSCIKGKGILAASLQLRKALKNTAFKYFLKVDVTKFYPSVDHQVLKMLLNRKIKDSEALELIFGIIDSAPGLPIGNYLSQYLANFYLSNFDHWVKEELGIKHYYRYCDDLVILGTDKPQLHKIRVAITEKLAELKLQLKPNYIVRPVTEGIDFVGYVHFGTHTLLRKSIKQSVARAVAENRQASVASYYGWPKYCNAKNLLKKLAMTKFSELNIKPKSSAMEGDKIEIYKVLNKEVEVLAFEIKPSKYAEKGNGNCLHLQLKVDGAKRVLFTGSGVLMDAIQQVPPEAFPITTTIIKQNESYLFT